MKLKQAILAVVDRDTLKAVVDDMEIQEVDRRSVEAMRTKVSRSRRSTFEVLIEYLNEKQVKAVCEEMSIDPKGRRMTLVERLLASTKKEEMKLKKTIPAEPVRPDTRERKKRRKESRSMTGKKSTPNAVEQEQAPVRLPDPPAGMMRVTKTELIWPGKYNDDGTLKDVPRVSLPFQVIETVNESRASRDARKGGIQPGLFDVYEGKEGDSFEEGWKNKLIWGDNLLVMGSLLEKFAGKIDLIYIDPPFATGADILELEMQTEGLISNRIRQDILKEKRADYGKKIVATLSQELTEDYGNNFNEKNLRRMIQFAEIFSDMEIVVTLSRQLSWSHFVAILPLKDGLQRNFYAEMGRIERLKMNNIRNQESGADPFPHMIN